VTCTFCELMKQKANLLFEDDDVYVMTSPEPMVAGQVSILPKKHAPILEAIPDDVLGKLFNAANKVSVGVFEALNCQGTNMIVKNGPAAGQKHNHAMIHVVPRFENDALQIGWDPKKASDEELADVESKLKSSSAPQSKSAEGEKTHPESDAPQEIEEEDLRVKQLRRIP